MQLLKRLFKIFGTRKVLEDTVVEEHISIGFIKDLVGQVQSDGVF